MNRISETSIESFIIRVYRETNRNGFIKAFTEESESQSISGYNKIERLLKTLYMKKLYLYPRFRLEIADLLDKYQPEVIELSQSLTFQMKAIQNAILVAMNSCITELKKSIPHLETSHMTLENGLFHSFDLSLRNQLDVDWHKIPYRTKQIVADIGVLRKLLDYLIRYDSFSFYYLLLRLKLSSTEQISPSLW